MCPTELHQVLDKAKEVLKFTILFLIYILSSRASALERKYLPVVSFSVTFQLPEEKISTLKT